MDRASLAVVVALCACAGADDDHDLLERLRAADYRGFARAPGWEEPRSPAQGGPHGSFLDIYTNDVVTEAIAAGAPLDVWPEGSIVVKDAWSDANGEDLRFIAAMEKDDGAWFWAEYKGSGKLSEAGVEDDACTRCHDAGDDGVLAFSLP